MTSNARVLTGLMERRALETAFAALSETTSLDQLVERAEAIAQHGSAAIPVLLSLLDIADPQLRGGLGHVAARLDPEQIVAALRGAARARERSDQARLTALMILDRFLHQPVEEALLAGLQDPDTVAAQSLRELVHEMGRNQFVVIEYLNQLAEQPPDVARTVIDAIPDQPASPHLITLLRMFAQGENKVLAQAALEQLSRTRSPEAVEALLGLGANLPPAPAAVAARSVRKLGMSGVSDRLEQSSRQPSNWRALLSPVDGAGAQVVWFVGARNVEGGDGSVDADVDAGVHGVLFSILCKDPGGIVASFGSLDVPVGELPPLQALGGTYVMRQAEDAPPIILLEVPFEAGRQVVREALELNWASGQAPPMEYRLLNPLIWEVPVEELSGGEGEQKPAAEESPPGASPLAVASDAYTAGLLDHPAFATWFWQAPELYDAAQRLGRRHTLAARSAQVRELAATHFGPELVNLYQRRLAGMARWLSLAFQPEAVVLARQAARRLADGAPAENLFVNRLIGQGLDVAIANLRNGYDPRRSASPSN
jgi:hypothetical protein